MKKGIDFKAVATKAGGHAAGAAAFTQLNKLKFMKAFTPEKQGIKGLITAAIGYIGVPMIADKMGLAKKGKTDLVNAVGEGLGMVGVMIAANAFVKAPAGQPALFPTISGVAGYEQSPIEGLGIAYEDEQYEDDGMAGYEQSPIEGGDYFDEEDY